MKTPFRTYYAASVDDELEDLEKPLTAYCEFEGLTIPESDIYDPYEDYWIPEGVELPEAINRFGCRCKK